MTPYRLIDGYCCFCGTCCLHLQGRRNENHKSHIEKKVLQNYLQGIVYWSDVNDNAAVTIILKLL
jgi:hypothetical protein